MPETDTRLPEPIDGAAVQQAIDEGLSELSRAERRQYDASLPHRNYYDLMFIVAMFGQRFNDLLAALRARAVDAGDGEANA